jgi:hypothetical protein
MFKDQLGEVKIGAEVTRHKNFTLKYSTIYEPSYQRVMHNIRCGVMKGGSRTNITG